MYVWFSIIYLTTMNCFSYCFTFLPARTSWERCLLFHKNKGEINFRALQLVLKISSQPEFTKRKRKTNRKLKCICTIHNRWVRCTSHWQNRLPQYDCLRINSCWEHCYGPSKLEDSMTHMLSCNHSLSSE